MAETLAAIMAVLCTLALGTYGVAVIDAAVGASLAGVKIGNIFSAPLYRSASLWLSPMDRAEAQGSGACSLTLWRLAPMLYLALAAVGLALVPWSADFVPIDIQTGIGLWGLIEALSTVAIFLYGWSANSRFPLLGGYRSVALGLAYILISMLVLCAVALPAGSLQLSAIVESQQELWNLARQPLGLPLFLIAALGISFWGPLNFADATDLAGGTSAEISGRARLMCQVGRAAMLIAFSGIGASAFLGGWLGPLLPGPVWLGLKMLFLLALLLLLGRLLPRLSPDRFIGLAWVLLLPMALATLGWARLQMLW